MSNNPTTDRRERYATAMDAVTGGICPADLIDAVMAVADSELAARRAADLRDAEEICDEAGASYTAKALNEHAAGAYELMARFRRKAEEAEQTAAVLPAVPVPPATHATAPDQPALRDRIAEAALLAVESAMDDTLLPAARQEALAGIAAVLPPPAARAAVLHGAADDVAAMRIGAEDPNPDEHVRGYNDGLDHAEAELRRMADEAQQQPDTETQPRRGDQFEAWLKAQRDACFGHATSWGAVDGLLDQYRLHADMGVPLDGHVCEARVVGDCDCLEQPAAGAGQDGAQT